MTYDLAVPLDLKKTQQWFGSIISRPLGDDSKQNPISPSGAPMELEAKEFISPSPYLQPAQRIQIYNQQYWWRLINVMQENFPLVLRMFGYHDFNQSLAVPYLHKHCPEHWSLNRLGFNFAQWILDEYEASDKLLVHHAAAIDWAYMHNFVAPEGWEIDPNAKPEELFNSKMSLQPYLTLFMLPYDLFSFRFEFIKKEPEHWIENDFPHLERKKDNSSYYFILYRNKKCDLVLEPLDRGEYILLQFFQDSSTIDSVCQQLENSSDSQLIEESEKKLHLWLQRWIGRQWIGPKLQTHEKLPS